jgi:hypothetical protein
MFLGKISNWLYLKVQKRAAGLVVPRFIELLIKHNAINEKFLDIGSGAGDLANLLHDNGLSVVCYDQNEAINIVRRHEYPALRSTDRLDDKAFSVNKFTSVTMFSVAQYLDEDSAEELFKFLQKHGVKKIFITDLIRSNNLIRDAISTLKNSATESGFLLVLLLLMFYIFYPFNKDRIKSKALMELDLSRIAMKYDFRIALYDNLGLSRVRRTMVLESKVDACDA